MPGKSNPAFSTSARICLVSQRNLHRAVSRGINYEFEDIICEVDDVEMLRLEPYNSFVIGEKVANQISRHIRIPSSNMGVRKARLKKDYDVFFAICQNARDLLSINRIKGWRDRCQTTICWLEEIWAKELQKWSGHLKILSKFDYVVLNCSASVKPVQEVIKRYCCYMPPAIDAILFCPYPDPPVRCIDVFSMGRKSTVTHKALLEMAQEKRLFYMYDTFENMETLIPKDHRILLANIAKRSRYFIANAAKINRKSEIQGQGEAGYRFFEGGAAGTVMIGANPDSEAFKENFDWPDSVITIPFDTPNISEILPELDSQLERLEQIRKNNVVQMLLRHDWVYRWKAILNIVGLEPMPALAARESQLKELAEIANKS